MKLRALAGLALAIACNGPHLVEHPTASHTFVARHDTTCGQEIAAADFVTKGAKWGEAILVVTCGPKQISGEIEISYQLDGTPQSHRASPFGLASDNARCLAGAAVLASAASGGTGMSSDGSAGGAGGASGAPAATLPPALVEASWAHEGCPAELGPGLSTMVPMNPRRPGLKFRVRLWSKTPQDLAGSIVQLRQVWFKPNVSDDKYQAYLDKEEAKARKEPIEWTAPEQDTEERPASSPPAPRAEVRPPSPSRAALWIPGYWHWTKAWVWVGGHWRIPDGDELVAAPRPPPPERDEAAPPGSDGVVWAPGYWAWDAGAAQYVWVAGRWQVPPSASVRWLRAGWRVSGRGAVFVPGAWIRR